MKERKKILFALLLLLNISTFAQENVMQQINSIKKRGDIYLFAEYTAVTSNEAIENARYLLNAEIAMWVEHNVQSDGEFSIAAVQNGIKELQAMRGDCIRAFAYICRDYILATINNDQLVIVPIMGESETSISEQFSIDIQKRKNEMAEKQLITYSYSPSEFEQEIMSISDANDIGMYIKRLESEGRIIGYGKFKDLPLGIDCYLFIYNRDMEIPAYLLKKEGRYINIKTGQQDRIENYKGCGAWWFQMK